MVGLTPEEEAMRGGPEAGRRADAALRRSARSDPRGSEAWLARVAGAAGSPLEMRRNAERSGLLQQEGHVRG